MNEFAGGLGQWVNKALEMGVPPMEIIGALETLKVELISNMLRDAVAAPPANEPPAPKLVLPDGAGGYR